MALYFVSNVNTTSDGKTIYTIYDLMSCYAINVTKDQLKGLIKAGDNVSGYKLDTLGRLIRDNLKKQHAKSKSAEDKLAEYVDHLNGTLAFKPMYFSEEDYNDPKFKQKMLENIFDPKLLEVVQPLLGNTR